MAQKNLFGIDNQLKRLSDLGDQLETLAMVVDFEVFRPDLIMALRRGDGSKGGRPPYDVVTMFKILVIGAMNDLSDERLEFLINDRLSFMRFLGLEVSDKVTDAKTIWLFREQLTQARAVENLFARFDKHLAKSGYLAMGGQIVDATIVAAPRQCNSDAEKADIKAGKVPKGWKDRPAKLAQKDRDARWTVKFSKAKQKADGSKHAIDIAIPAFGYKNHIAIDREHGLIRKWKATDAARYDGAQLPELLNKGNTASGVWADTAYRSKKNEAWLTKNGFVSHIHTKKPKGRPMSERASKANGKRSKVRAFVEHPFARMKGPMALFIRTIGIARATTKIGMANLVYNIQRLVWLAGRGAPA